MNGPSRYFLEACLALLHSGLERKPGGLFVLGICGAQGSGKSTLARALEERCAAQGLAVARLSLDDVYLTRSERESLASEVHPLLRTRGVPGTHDIGMAMDVIGGLAAGRPVLLPRFDKARDDRAPASGWPLAPAGCAALILEGWCLGARPQGEGDLALPVNALEQAEDPDGTWRRFANAALAGDYQRLFARIDALVLLAAPDFEIVHDWRMEQELATGISAPMGAAALHRFIQHYERLTRHILSEMPRRADLLVRLDRNRTPLSIRGRDASELADNS